MLNDILRLGKAGYEVIITNDKERNCMRIIVSKGEEAFKYEYSPSREKLIEYRDIVRRVWNGEFGNGLKRCEALIKAGYNPFVIQALVNKAPDGRVSHITIDDIFMIEAENIIARMVAEIERLEKNAE